MKSRRSFVKSAATLAAAPLIVPASVLGRDSTPPSDRVILGHIGVGNRGGGLLSSFLQLEESYSVAVSDCFKSRREMRAAQIDNSYADKFEKAGYKSCAMYADFRELLARPDIDAVVIATPDHWHVPIAIEAVKAGKDVYVEKPLGISVELNQQIRRAVHQQGAVFQYGTQQRSSWQFQFACELVRNGYIGRLQRIEAWCPGFYAADQFTEQPYGSTKPIPVPDGFDYDRWLGPAPYTPYTADRCTEWGSYYHYDNSLGFIAGWGAHPLDIAQWGNNSDETAPVDYEGSGSIIGSGLYNVIESWDVKCRYENGVEMHFMSDHIAEPIVRKYHPRFNSHGTTFFGTEGWVSVDRTNVYAGPQSLLQIRLKPSDIRLNESSNHYRNFVQCVKSRKQPISPVNAAVQSDIICHLGDICIRLNRKLKWDPAGEKVIGDDEANRMLRRSLRSPWVV